MSNKINEIITTINREEIIKFVVRYPGHVDLDISKDYQNVDGFIVLTAQAADELCAQLQEAVKAAYARAEAEKPLFKQIGMEDV